MATLDDLIKDFTPLIRNEFLKVIATIKSGAVLSRMTAFIEAGDPIGAFKTLGLTPAALRPVTSIIEAAFERGGVLTITAIKKPKTATVFHFDVRNSRAEKIIKEQSDKLISGIEAETINNVRSLISQGVLDGRNPKNIALDIVGRVDPVTKRRVGGIVGLNEPQKAARDKAIKELQSLDVNYLTRERRDKRFDTVFKTAIKDKKPLSIETVNKLSGRYSDNLLHLRGETIGRTEAIAALNKSEYEAISQITESGNVKSKNVRRFWDSAGRDGKTRGSHLEMEGQEQGFDEPFTTPDGYKLMFPGDGSLGAPASQTVNCRCRVRLEVDWLAEAL